MNINYDSPFNFKPIPTITPASSYWENDTWKFNMAEITVGTGVSPSWVDIILSGNTALTLVNSKANGLNYLKLFGGTEQLPETYLDTVTLSGGCEQRNLPSGFTQVEYLESSGEQYIDTGVVPKTTLSVKIKYNVLELASTNNIAIFGSISSQFGLFSGGAGSPTQYYINSGATSLSNIPFALNTIREEEYINDTMIRDGVTYTTNPIVENNISMTLFGRNTGSEVARIGTLRIYYFTLYDNGALIQNLIPARRNSDNVLGMYDTVTGNFLTNSGTGTFTAGADAIPTPTNPMDIVCNNGVVKVSKNLFDKNDVNLQNRNRSLSLTKEGYWYYAEGSTSLACRCLPNTQYTISGANSGTTIFRVATIDINTLPSEQDTNDIPYSYIYRATQNEVHTFVTPSTAKWIIVQVSGAFFDSTLNTIQIEQGSTPTPYMPYGQIYTDGTQEVVTDSVGNTASAEMLLKVGNYKDTQEVISGAVTRNIGILVLDGTEEWTTVTLTNCYTLANSIGRGTMQNRRVLCTHFDSADSLPDASSRQGLAFIGNLQNAYTIGFGATTEFSTVTEWSNWLKAQYNAGTPVIVIYPKSVATTETVSGQFLSKSPVTQTAGSISGMTINAVSSSHTTPTPQQPLQINCNNGVVKVSKNLFDKNNYEEIDGYVDTTTGELKIISGSANVQRCVVLNVKPNTTYSISGILNSGYGTFATKTIGSMATSRISGNGTLTTGANDNYIIGLVRTTNGAYDYRDTLQIEQGSTATPYMPYGQIYTDGTTETVEITGKNLFDKDNNLLEGYYIVINTGNLAKSSDGSSSCFKDFLPSRPNVTYTMSRINRVAGTAMRMWAYDKDKNPISLVFNSKIEDIEVTGTTPNGTAYIRCSFGSIPNYSQNIQLEQGSTATEYEPYTVLGTATAEMLLKVGDYKDVQEVLTGSVTRNIGIKVLDGTEDWIESSTVGKFNAQHLLDGADARITQNTTCFCTHFLGVVPSISLANMEDLTCKAGWISGSTNFDSLYVAYAKYENNLVGFKQYLATQYANGTPVIVVYPLATATTETVTAQPLTIQEGTNVVEITEASMSNLPLEVSYKAGVTVTITEVQNAQLDNSVEVTING